MAGQFAVAFSSQLIGSGIVAGGPFYCAGIDGPRFMSNAIERCMTPLGAAPSAKLALDHAKKFEAQKDIDALSNLKKHRIYIFSGSADNIVSTKVVDQTHNFYVLAGVPQGQIRYVTNLNAGHALLTDNTLDLACAVNAAPNINNCGFFQSHDILRHIYGNLAAPVQRLAGGLQSFDQTEFFEGLPRHGMASNGQVYVPESCQRDRCRVHVVFHGCTQEESRIGTRFYGTTGYNEIADNNHLIILYPQIKTDPARNPQGCWDFWGYSSADETAPDFYTQSAPQMQAVMRMVQRLSSGSGSMK